MVEVHGALNTVAVSLMKVCLRNIRLKKSIFVILRYIKFLFR